MRIAKFTIAGEVRFGLVDGPELVVFKGHPLFSGYETTGERVALKDVQLLPPTLPTSKIVCIGKNYADHAAEMGSEAPKEPLIFLKPTTSLIGDGETIVLPAIAERVDHEGELAIVIGDVAKNVTEADALGYVWGFTIANDVTARDIQDRDGQWTRAKGFDTFCPLGPFLCLGAPPDALQVRCHVNGVARQDSDTRQMVFDWLALVVFVSDIMTLLPGDVILTGTPAGVGPLQDGDTVDVFVQGAGLLRSPVTLRSDRAAAGR